MVLFYGVGTSLDNRRMHGVCRAMVPVSSAGKYGWRLGDIHHGLARLAAFFERRVRCFYGIQRVTAVDANVQRTLLDGGEDIVGATLYRFDIG